MGETERLWQQYIDGRSADVRRTLIETYAPLARYVVDRLNLRPGAALEYDDLLSQAVVGLIDAVDRFDPTRGIKFETYAYYRIRGAVMDMLRELDWLPRSIRQREAQLSRAYAVLEDRGGRPPTAGGFTLLSTALIGLYEGLLTLADGVDQPLGPRRL